MMGDPFKRLGTAQEIADVLAFLAGPEAGWVTGLNIHAEGSSLIRKNSSSSRSGTTLRPVLSEQFREALKKLVLTLYDERSVSLLVPNRDCCRNIAIPGP
jgi:hypothetical protein